MKFAVGIIAGALGVGLIAFGIGRLAGLIRKREHALIVVGGILLTLVILIGAGIIVTSKQVSGPLIIWNAVGLLLILFAGIRNGFYSSPAWRKPGNRSLAVLIGGTLLISLGLGIMLWAKNAPALDQVKQLGLLDAEKYEPKKNKACPDNLLSLYTAFSLYAQDWDGLPPAANWLDNEDLTSKVRENTWLHCPEVSNRNDERYGYAYNQSVAGLKLNGKPLKEMPNAATTPLIYDSTNLEKNAHDAVATLPKPGRHSGRNNILYCDGHVEPVAPK